MNLWYASNLCKKGLRIWGGEGAFRELCSCAYVYPIELGPVCAHACTAIARSLTMHLALFASHRPAVNSVNHDIHVSRVVSTGTRHADATNNVS